MSTDAAKQAAYAAKRAKLLPTYPTIEYRITFRDGTEKTERVVGPSQVVALYPDAVQITRTDWGGFW